jgi:[acyl-carrier-protein] S-malonyltransferase
MGKTAFLFPGQGAQAVGMGVAAAEGSPAAAAVFREAADILGFDLLAACRSGPQEELNRTDTAQPAIYTVSAALLAAMKEKGVPAAPPDFAAGLSLGEFTALHYAGAYSFADGLRLVRRRGQLMQQAAEKSAGGMVSVIGLDAAKARELCAAAAAGGLLVPANFLCPGNIVLSGDKAACARAVETAEKTFAAKAVALAVAGAFHTAHMRPAAEGLAAVLAETAVAAPRIPVISNTDAGPHGDPAAIRATLVRQLDNPVLWEQSMARLLDSGVEAFYEIGPGRVLAGLLKRIRRTVKVINVQTVQDLSAL